MHTIPKQVVVVVIGVVVGIAAAFAGEEVVHARRPSALYVTAVPPAHPRQDSKVQLERLGQALRMFALESPGHNFPALNVRAGELSMDPHAIVPEYIHDASLFVSPAHPEAERLKERALREPLSVVDDRSYWYLGYLLPDEDTGLVFLEAFKGAVKAGQQLEDDIEIGGFGTVYRLRDGVERTAVTDINNSGAAREMRARIPIMIERPGLQDGGSNVLFLDGHVEFVPYPGRFPMTEDFIAALLTLDTLESQSGEKSR